MEITTETASKIITGLLKNSLEMLEFYKHAHNSVSDEDIKQIFIFYIQRRKEIVNELKNEIVKINPLETFDIVLNSFFNAGTGEPAIVNEDIRIILSVCERNEEESVKMYKSAINEGLSPKLTSLISRQYGDVKEAHYHMKLLRDSRSN